jgi:uncharacterized membrane protein (GlpM family)
MKEFFVHFVVGGLVVALATLYGTRGQSFLAAFIAMFPSMTVLTFALVYRSGGNAAVVNYAKSFLYLVPPWLLYVFSVAFLCDRIGIWRALALGVALYIAAAAVLLRLR